LTSACVSEATREKPSLAAVARVITAGLCIEASFKRGKSEAGMDAYQVRTVRRESTVEECGKTSGYTRIRLALGAQLSGPPRRVSSMLLKGDLRGKQAPKTSSLGSGMPW